MRVRLRVRSLAFCLLPFFVLDIVAQADSQGPIVEGVQGRVDSVDGQAYEAFLELQYGIFPNESHRFQKATLASGIVWSPANEASQCEQKTLSGSRGQKSEENCLRLNIYRKKGTSSGDLKAVVVIIHGGDFFLGSNNDPFYSGAPLAAIGDVITVVINYRLGILGFAEVRNQIKGNIGLFDQQLALQWIQANIRTFGGDPGQVTLAGSGAGAMSITAHLVTQSHMGAPLFQSAIMDNGVLDRTFVDGEHHVTARMREVAKKLCHPKPHALDQAVKCIRNLTAKDLVDASIHFSENKPVQAFYPTKDAEFIPNGFERPKKLSDREFRAVRLMIGYASDRKSLFANVKPFDTSAKIDKERSLRDFILELANIHRFRPLHRSLKAERRTREDNYKMMTEAYNLKTSNRALLLRRISKFIRDGRVLCPTNAFITNYARCNQQVYVYHFERYPKTSFVGADSSALYGELYEGSFEHFIGSPLIAGRFDLLQQDKQYIRECISMVADFARGSVPSFRRVEFPDFSVTGKILRFVDESSQKPVVANTLVQGKRCSKVFKYFDTMNAPKTNLEAHLEL